MSEELDLVAHKMLVYFNNKQASWMKDNCIACRLAYNFAIDRLRHPLMPYEACLDAADQPAKFSSRIDGAIQPSLLDFKQVKFPSAFDVSKLWSIERDRLHPWMKDRGLSLDTISGTFNNNYGAALNQWKIAKWSKDKMPVFHGKGARLSSIWRGRLFKQVDYTHFNLPNKMGNFKLSTPLRFHGEIRSVTFSEQSGKWYASFLIKTSLPKPQSAPVGTSVGIDVGVVQFASLSNGEQFAPAMDFDVEQKRLAQLQRQLSRKEGPVKGKKKASKNWLRLKQRVQKQHQKIANKRRDYIEVVSKSIAERFETVAIEDLKIKNMSASAKGDEENPGKNVAQKAGLNRSILNGGFYQFRTRLEAKVNARSGKFIAVNPAYTSQTCAACGYVAKENRVTQDQFRCVECGHENNADINAAQNILVRALNPNKEIVVTPRRKKERSQQGDSHPESLPTEPVTVLAKESDTHGALIGTRNSEKVKRHHCEKRVFAAKQLAFAL